MRILMVNKFLYPKGGAETYLLKLGQYLTEQGHEVQYFGMEDKRRCLSNGVEAYTKNLDFHESSKLERLTYPVKIIYSAEARKKIRQVLDDFQPEAIHLNNFNYQLTPSVLLEIGKWKRETGKRAEVVYTAHDPQLVCPNHMLYNPNTYQVCEKCLNGKYRSCISGRCVHGSLLRSAAGAAESWFWHKKQVYRYIDTIVCCSAFIKTKVDTDPLLAPKTIALHNFIDMVEKKETSKKGYVLYFGRFSLEKGLDTLLEVCRQLPDIPFVFAGSGPLESKLAGIPNVKNVGFQSGEALEKLIREAQFTVYPSECYENCPFSVLESISYGTPVIGADIGGIPELIRVEYNGELFQPGNVEDLKKNIRVLWEDKQRQAQYSKNCLETRFDTVQEYTEKLLKIYKGQSGKKKDKNIKKNKMKILHTTALDADGITSFVINTAALIDRDRYEIDVVTYRHGTEFAQSSLERCGGRKYEVDIEKIRFKPAKMWRKFWGIYHVIRDNKIQVFHLDTESTDQLFLAFAAKLAGVRTVLYHSHSASSGRVGKLRKCIEEISRVLMPWVVDGYLACSDAAAESVFPKKVVSKKEYYLVNNGINAEKYRYNPEIREKYRREFGVENQLVLGHIGRFVPLKNQSFLVEVFEELLKKRPDSVLVFLGDGETRMSVEEKVKEKHLENKVVFFGIRNDVEGILQMMDVFVLPSVYEGVPLSAVEAQAAGLPCVLSDTVSKDVKLTETVVYMPLNQKPGEWAEKILFMAQEKRRDMLEEIRSGGYDMAEVVKGLSKLYEGKK